MTKRTAKRAAAKTRAKKARTDPVLATLASAILRECQKQSLNSRSSLLEADVAAEEAKLENLRASHVQLVGMAVMEEAALVAFRAEGAATAAKHSLADATTIANASLNVLKRQQVAQKASQTDLAQAEAEKCCLESAFKGLCITPVVLGPDGLALGMTCSPEIRDDSWLRGFPVSAPPRFVEQLAKTISSDVSILGAAVSAQTLVLGECDAAVQAAEQEYENNKAVELHAAADLEVAEKELLDREVVLDNARQAVTEHEFQIDAVRVSLDKARMNLRAFQDGPLAKFLACESDSVPMPSNSVAVDVNSVPEIAATSAFQGPMAADSTRQPLGELRPFEIKMDPALNQANIVDEADRAVTVKAAGA